MNHPYKKRKTGVYKPISTEQRRANMSANYAIKMGKLVRKPCEICGITKVDAHHDDYNKPLEVKWFCRKHHMEYHYKQKEIKRLDTITNKPFGGNPEDFIVWYNP